MLPSPDSRLHDQIRETYVRERRAFESRVSGVKSSYGLKPIPKWDGTEDSSGRAIRSDKYGRNYKPIWPKIAAFAVKNGVDPLTLIKNRFLNTRGPTAPEPTDCMSQTALELCKHDQVSVDDLNKRLYQFQDIFQNEAEGRAHYIDKYGWTPEKVIDSVARDLTLPFNDLYRYYLASVNGIVDLAEKHRPNAVLEYARFIRGYSESLWSEIIPQELASEAAITVG